MAHASTVVTEPTLSPGRPRRRWLRWVTRVAMVLGGLALGLVIAEVVFYYRDDGAFPHLNIYVADPDLGVRLEPGATEQVSFGGNPVTSVRINGEGYRGGAWPPARPDDVLVVGDSQVFGLGVEENQAFAAVVAGQLHRTVLNGGVPTYGPGEYRAVIAEQLARRHPSTVVLTLNLVNDLFEAERANKDRHAVWDGWAVRKETAPAEVTSFPGRDLLFRRSHLVFAFRKWLNSDDKIDERGLASEGTWRDAVATGERVARERTAIEAARHLFLAEITKLRQGLGEAEAEIDESILELLADEEGADRFTIETARANPGDIVSDDEFAEGGRSIEVTARQIAAAASVRARLRTKLERWAKAHPNQQGTQALAQLGTRDHALARLGELDRKRVEAALEPPLGAYLRDVQQLVESAGARLVVVILPLDVQVSADEWAKYGAPPIDMTPSKTIARELVALCKRIGVSALDATPVLASAEPGAFLDKDIHMTPKGHAAIAAAVADLLAKPAPVPIVVSERSPVPLPAIWAHSPEVVVTGSSAAGCETKQVREWLRVRCGKIGQVWPVGVEVERDDGGEALTLVMPREVSLVIPVVKGRELVATIAWPDHTRVLRVGWPDGADRPTQAFDPPVETPPIEVDRSTVMTFQSPVERAICNCWQHEVGGTRYTAREEVFTCPGAYGAADARCVETYGDGGGRCAELLACIRRDPASLP